MDCTASPLHSRRHGVRGQARSARAVACTAVLEVRGESLHDDDKTTADGGAALRELWCDRGHASPSISHSRRVDIVIAEML